MPYILIVLSMVGLAGMAFVTLFALFGRPARDEN